MMMNVPKVLHGTTIAPGTWELDKRVRSRTSLFLFLVLASSHPTHIRRMQFLVESVTTTSAFFGAVQRAPELSFSGGGGEGFHGRDELLRELGALEGGPLPELEKSVAERKHLLAQARQLLDTLVSDLATARLEVERRDGAVASSQGVLKKLRERMEEVRGLDG